MSLIGYDKSWGLGQIDKSLLKSNSNQDELQKMRMMDSYTEAIIPLGILLFMLFNT